VSGAVGGFGCGNCGLFSNVGKNVCGGRYFGSVDDINGFGVSGG
jgi:hypothetical protein